jgi:hypothetical protein
MEPQYVVDPPYIEGYFEKMNESRTQVRFIVSLN